MGPGKNTGNSPLNMSVGATLTRHVVTYPARWCALILDIPKLSAPYQNWCQMFSLKWLITAFKTPSSHRKSHRKSVTADQRMRTQTRRAGAKSRDQVSRLEQRVTDLRPGATLRCDFALNNGFPNEIMILWFPFLSIFPSKTRR